MPLVGIRRNAEAMLIDRLQAELDQEPGRGEQHELVLLLQQPRKPAQHDEGEQRDDQQAGDQAELLAGDGEDEVGMGVGQYVLDRALARAAAPKPAIDKGFERAATW